jgi:hypothetical protein
MRSVYQSAYLLEACCEIDCGVGDRTVESGAHTLDSAMKPLRLHHHKGTIGCRISLSF